MSIEKKTKPTKTMHSKYKTSWGDMTVSVSADWGQASCAVRGDDHGRQVADFRHSWKRALRAQLEELACIEGMDEDDTEEAVNKAMREAEGLEDLDITTIEDPESEEAQWLADETEEERIICNLQEAVGEKDEDLIRGWTCVAQAKGITFTVESGDPEEDIREDETNYVTVSRKLLAGSDTIAEWTICAQGWWVGSKGNPNYDVGWNVEENTDGGDGLKPHIEAMTDLLGITDEAKELPDVPEPDAPEECDEADAEFCVMIRNPYTQGMEEFDPITFHPDRDHAERAMASVERSFAAANSQNSYGPEWRIGTKDENTGKWKSDEGVEEWP